MADDYSDAVKRFAGMVPEGVETEAEIREWMEDRFERDTLSQTAIDTFAPDVEDRVQGDRGPELGEAGDYQYTPEGGWRDTGTGRWTDEPE